MDGKDRIEVEQPRGKVDNKGKSTGGNTTNGGSNGKTTPTITGGSAGGNTPAGETKKQTTKVVGLPIENNIPVPPTINIPVSAEPKKKKTSSKSDKELDKTLESNLRLLIGSGFGFATKLTSNPIWEISDEEATAISTPATRILQRLSLNESMNKYADYIALTAALGMVIVPRVIMQQAEPKEKGVISDGGKKNKAKKSDSKPNPAVSTSNPPNNVTNIKAALDYGN